MDRSLPRIAILIPAILVCLTPAIAGPPPRGGLGVCVPGDPDRDGDGEPDACDVDDGWIFLEMADPGTIHYQREVLFGAYNIYRGEMTVLRTPPVSTYTRNPASTDAARWCDETAGALTDSWSPPAGLIVFYVATGTTSEGETFPGHDSAGAPRIVDPPAIPGFRPVGSHPVSSMRQPLSRAAAGPRARHDRRPAPKSGVRCAAAMGSPTTTPAWRLRLA